MRKLILFKADKGEIQKYRSETATTVGESFYRVANAGSVPSLIDTIAEHYCSSNKPVPEPGYRLTETVPDDQESFRDSGWEVVRVDEYTPDIPYPQGAEFGSIYICYCAYKPLAPEDTWTKKAHRIAPSLDSFGGDKAAYEKWLESQPVAMQEESKAVTNWMETQVKQHAEV
ncbi:MAG: hypothetical protein IGS48_21110 [Oscillatoriales cyanobacterium C42_A2020_001]|nr:hypothetical protein [Leptolyngbyaceae cyanobacterium C42_A2020_001]